ncbi:hypothetical protein BU24DRAFT_466957 [Aaosphaeria arxii CBS 175.79]|uniref:Uncharacterized protein n=1 Tax=Aaosphaeria arxii CBS 175.79 TaxID=1450172 RepID=A0A6A5XBJ9_9PLEO|nr:uncharacterized protein BU24DRAFT_466957 [Aaosphaeria arxii CBS 175.79]KAF2010300.1 hypothetical protein BU24DRAFT_466957 [Aaosphaeria arxii CBS 175.79]
MSTSGPRFHIPFPSNFLSLNTPTKRSASLDGSVTAPTPAPEHSFLSNRSVAHRHPSISSVTSEDSTRSTPPAAALDAAVAPVPTPKSPTFLALNHKSAAPPKNAQALRGVVDHSFLSNRH